MSEPTQNHYQVLGVERAADERSIKKAYFTLVRQHPPDTHPDEFKRIREAYEVLSDPIARKRFDAADHTYSEYDDATAATLRETEEAAKSGDDATVQAKLDALLEEHPEILIARENLAFSYTRTNNHEQALKHFTELAARAPETARYHFFQGLALRRMDRPDEAQAPIERAHEFAPEELRFTVGLVDVLAQRKQFSDARAVLDVALSVRSPTSEEGIGLALRKIDLLFVMDEVREAKSEVAELLAAVRASTDPELPKYAATQLAGLAAALFFRKQISLANDLLGSCRELHPESPVLRPYPTSATIAFASLPEDGRAWVACQKAGPTTPTVAQPIWPAPLLALLGAVGLALITRVALFTDPTPAGGGYLVFSALLIAATTAAFAYAIRGIRRIVQSPLRAFTTLESLYLLQANADQLTLYPLFNLANLSAAHHHTNGVYSHTLITLWFDAKQVTVRLVGQDYAQGWLNFLLECRNRSLELMMEGYLEAERGADLIPPALLDTHAAHAAKTRTETKRWALRTAAVALVLWGAAIPLHSRKVDDARWRTAIRSDSIDSYAAYLSAEPGGRHADEAKQAMDRRFDEAAAALKAASDPRAKGARALADVLAALRRRGASKVPLTLQVAPVSGSSAFLSAWDATSGAKREAELIARLNEVLGNAGVGAAMRFELGNSSAAPAAILIRCSPGADGYKLASNEGSWLPSFKIEWTAQITIEGAPAFDVALTTEMPSEVRVLPHESDATIYTRTSDQMLKAFADQLAEALGLGSTAAAVRYANGPASAASRELASPYAH